MEKLTEAEALRSEYLDLMKTLYATCLAGLNRAKAHMVGTMLGFLVTQSAFLGALFFLEDTGVIVIFVIVGLLTLWWCSTFIKERAKVEEAKREYEAIGKRLSIIEREYLTLTGKELRSSFTANEVQQAFVGFPPVRLVLRLGSPDPKRTAGHRAPGAA